MGETRVDLLHLLEDLRDAYPGPTEETILTEIIANSLDSGASRILITADPAQTTLAVVDNGSGMQRRELARYHDVAASTKARGQGIGFAGVGIKLGLLVCEEVLTETRRGKTHVATCWRLVSRHRAPWKWVPPPGLVAERGTAVSLKLQNALSPLLDPGFLEGALQRHFQTLLDPLFDQILAPQYPQGVRFEVNGRPIEKQHGPTPAQAPLRIHFARKRKPSALGYLVRTDRPLPDDQQGLAVSTFGKIIKCGWDWLGVTPAWPDRIGGLIEAPGLAACLTLTKGDFVRVGSRGAVYLAYRKAIQEAVSRQLSAWGDARGATEQAPPRVVRPLERDLEWVLEDLSDEFPLLATLVEHRAGGQKRLPIGTSGKVIGESVLVAASPELPAGTAEIETDNAEPTPELGNGDRPQADGETTEIEQSKRSESDGGGIRLPGRGGPRRPMRYGLGIQFEDRPGDPELGRLLESTVWVNQAHPAYRRAMASHSVGYHICLAVALALAPLAVESAKEHEFVTVFLSRWGEALQRPKGRRYRTK